MEFILELSAMKRGKTMICVLFVCLGNICRSPMAEAVFRDKIKKADAVERVAVDSAGTGNWHLGSRPHRGTRKILTDAGISFENIRARQIVPDDFRRFDKIIAMDRNNEQDLRRMAGQNKVYASRIFRFMQLLENRPTADVPDPYYTGRFDEVFQLVDRGTDVLLGRLLAP